MKATIATAAILFLPLVGRLGAEVSIRELDDRIRVEIDGQLVTEWRHKDWVAPFLYPVIGPTGENITRHFPMKEGLPSEDQDHPHHRSIRFSHSDVNGFNFWWAPPKRRAGHTAEVRLEKIEQMTSGKTGQLILTNLWLGDGELSMRERVRLAFTPLANRQLLMDYDVELQAVGAPVVFGDKRDGGLLARVAGTMKAVPDAGAILNSRGDKDKSAWGKRAEWTDYSGPDTSGKTVGIAMFDHPANLRFPTHWHARTYGLMTANRFGTDHFKGNYEDHKTVICAPSAGKNCPACESNSGAYTIATGATLRLRHRFYFHHGDALVANVADQYEAYTSDAESVLLRMRALHRDRKWRELIGQFGERDFALLWPAKPASEAFQLRGQIYSFTKDGKRADADLKAALKLAPDNTAIWLILAENCVNNLNDDDRAIAAYQKVIGITGSNNQGWQALTATVGLARLYTDQVKLDDALAVLEPYGDLRETPESWRIRLLRCLGHIHAARGDEQAALANFRKALELEEEP